MDYLNYYNIARYKYQLAKPFAIKTNVHPEENILFNHEGAVISLKTDGMLHVTGPFRWDGNSGGIETESFVTAAFVHDVLYLLIRHKYLSLHPYRKLADMELKRLCIAAGMFRVRAHYIYLAVRQFGEKHAIGD